MDGNTTMTVEMRTEPIQHRPFLTETADTGVTAETANLMTMMQR